MADRSYPEKQHTKYTPTGEKPGYNKSSQSTGVGHQGHDSRMPHPFGITPPNAETGEGRNGS